MQKLLLTLLALTFLLPTSVSAQTPQSPVYEKAIVIAVTKDGIKDVGGKKNPYQQLSLQIISGSEKGKKIQLEYGGQTIIAESQKVYVNDKVIISKTTFRDKVVYSLVDRYRLPSLFLIAAIFFGLVIILTGKRGIGSISGLAISLLIIVAFIIPQILNGGDPLVISIIGSIIIMLVTLYLAHGMNGRTTIAVVATCVSLVLTGCLAILAVHITKLSGLGSEDAYNLLLGSAKPINLQGLLLGGIIIGALGVLDDTTTTQSTTIAELAEANPSYSMKTLFKKGMIIGREHITSLVNTLVLAYAGAAMGIFIFIILALQHHLQPWWVIFNSEILAEEIVRTLAGSIGLVLAVPITTFLAAFFAKNELIIK